jgi:hypothetical protein
MLNPDGKTDTDGNVGTRLAHSGQGLPNLASCKIALRALSIIAWSGEPTFRQLRPLTFGRPLLAEFSETPTLESFFAIVSVAFGDLRHEVVTLGDG